MTKLADELEALHIVFDGPPSHEAGRFVECETPDGRGLNAGEWHERDDGLWELRIPASLFAALRQPDAVPGDLVESAWLGLKARVCSDPSKATRCVMVSRNDLAAAIQSLTAENATLLFKCREAEEGWKNALIAPLTWQAELTAERDALQQALADAQGAMTLTAEIGVTYFDQRNEALARVTELEAGVGNIKKLATKRLFEGGPDGNLAAIEGFARALLEGSKP